eukprot:scaffold24012_cov186-Cylindrotheca_fusiformis.AAC.1
MMIFYCSYYYYNGNFPNTFIISPHHHTQSAQPKAVKSNKMNCMHSLPTLGAAQYLAYLFRSETKKSGLVKRIFCKYMAKEPDNVLSVDFTVMSTFAVPPLCG